jgi:hypothetical protein
MTSIDTLVGDKRPKHTHIFRKEKNLHYIEPHWCSSRLFEIESFLGPIWDPFCGTGRVADAARAAGYRTYATDLVDCGYEHFNGVQDFLTVNDLHPDVNLVGNPPFDDRVLQHALSLAPHKAAFIWPLARAVAAHEWLSKAPLARVLLLTPRPSMPPSTYIQAGKKPEGGRVEHAWLVFERGYCGAPPLRWLHRDFDVRTQEGYVW